MSYQLFYSEKSAAMGIRVMLEEMNQSYELIDTSITMDVPRDPKVLALNPNGWIPVLIWEAGAIYECGAITTFLCDRHSDSNLIPGIDHPDRGLFLQWIFFFSSSIQNAYQMTYYPFRFCDGEEDEASVKRRSITRLSELWQVIDDAIGDNDWLVGNRFSAADIYLFMLTTWIGTNLGHPSISSFSNVYRVANGVMQRPSVQLVYKNWIKNPEA